MGFFSDVGSMLGFGGRSSNGSADMDRAREAARQGIDIGDQAAAQQNAKANEWENMGNQQNQANQDQYHNLNNYFNQYQQDTMNQQKNNYDKTKQEFNTNADLARERLKAEIAATGATFESGDALSRGLTQADNQRNLGLEQITNQQNNELQQTRDNVFHNLLSTNSLGNNIMNTGFGLQNNAWGSAQGLRNNATNLRIGGRNAEAGIDSALGQSKAQTQDARFGNTLNLAGTVISSVLGGRSK